MKSPLESLDYSKSHAGFTGCLYFVFTSHFLAAFHQGMLSATKFDMFQ